MSSDGADELFFEAEEAVSREGLPASGSANMTPTVDGAQSHRSGHVSHRDGDEHTPETPRVIISQRAPRTRSIDSRRTNITAQAHHHYRRSLHLPPVPPIPPHILQTGRPASISTPSDIASPRLGRARSRPSRDADIAPSPAIRVERPKSVAGHYFAATRRALSPSPTFHHREIGAIQAEDASSEGRRLTARRRSFSALQRRVHQRTAADIEGRGDNERGRERDSMARERAGRGEDLFLELAHDSEDTTARLPSRGDRAASRLSQAGKRRSLPTGADVSNLTSSAERRPTSSGHLLAARAAARRDMLPSDLQSHTHHPRRTPSRDSFDADDALSASGRSYSGRPNRFSNLTERSPLSPPQPGHRLRSPELPSYGRGRPSFGISTQAKNNTRQLQLAAEIAGSQYESPAESSEAKQSQPGSSAESQGAESVWDELDDLKSRIKKLELTGKLPTTSGAAMSGDSSERPRTATTAPTTINSSPKQDRKPEAENKPSHAGADSNGGSNVSTIHPLLHSALAKARPLLTPTLYRTLEATASDALQLSALTGSAGPQGTTFSAASIINGVTVSDRQVRRKADSMCRNFTDLTLALCEGKHEMATATASPLAVHSMKSSPTIRYSRSSIGASDHLARDSNRPMSRLEARRTSILGLQSPGSNGGSVHESADDLSASELEGTPDPPRDPQRELTRVSRASSRLLAVRPQRYEEASGDDDPTIRPLSRAMTDAGHFSNRRSGQFSSPGQPASSSGLRDSLAARRANASAQASNRQLQSRVSSLTSEVGRRRWTKETTPPVVEEEGLADDYTPALSHSRRRVTSLGHFRERKMVGEGGMPSRTTSLSSRRHVVAD
ncbi:hypothetical protein B0A50_06715 [Salinomyces thailandicus]|uniref:LPXTG-motif cell wall anchor domain protein n=1 Tax=Salinomyces thailandicus TaxID=706561 RepID=A0A4U0TRI4_9PEZI|nr:hypothetical protein B0A50_06715 [Salinomyces thailandica]